MPGTFAEMQPPTVELMVGDRVMLLSEDHSEVEGVGRIYQVLRDDESKRVTEYWYVESGPRTGGSVYRYPPDRIQRYPVIDLPDLFVARVVHLARRMGVL